MSPVTSEPHGDKPLASSVDPDAISASVIVARASVEWTKETLNLGSGGGNSEIVSFGDINADGHDDVLLLGDGGLLQYQQGNGSSHFSSPKELGKVADASNVFAGADFNGDGRCDLFSINSAGELFAHPIEKNFRIGSPQYIGSGFSDVLASSVTAKGVGGYPMFVMLRSNALEILPMNAEHKLLAPITIDGPWSSVQSVTFGDDMTGDGVADLWTTFRNGQLRLYSLSNVGKTHLISFEKLGSKWTNAKRLFADNKAKGIYATFKDGTLKRYSLKKFVPRFLAKQAPKFSPENAPKSASFIGANVNIDFSHPQAQVSIPSGKNCHIGISFSKVTEPSGCRYGSGDLKVMVAGDSHAAAWAPAMQKLAGEGYFSLEYNTRDACSLQNRGLTGEVTEYPACLEWKKKVVKRIKDNPPQILMLSNYVYSKNITLSAHEAAMRDLLDQIPRTIQIVFIRDTPRYGEHNIECLSRNLENPGACAVNRAEGEDQRYFNVNKKLATEYNAKILDLNDYICDSSKCYPAIGDTVVAKDQHHLTHDFAEKMTPAVLSGLKSIGIVD